MATRVGGSAVASASSVASVNLTLPAGIVDGDVAFIACAYNQSISDNTITSGWAIEDTIDYSATMRARLYSRTLTAAESGTTVTLGNPSTQRLSGVVEVYRTAINSTVKYSRSETGSTGVTSHTAPSGASTASGFSVAFFVERSSTPSASVTAPSGYVLRNSAFGTGNGSTSAAAADKLATVAAGTTIGGGAWVASQANVPVVMWVVGVAEPTGPTTVGKDLTIRHNVSNTTTVGKSLTVRHNVGFTSNVATRVGGATFASSSSVTSFNLTLPAGIQTGDVAWLVHTYNQTTADSVLPAGWTLEDTQDFSATMRARLYSKTLVSGDSGTVVAISNAGSQRLGATVEVYRGVTTRNALITRIETSAVAAHTGPSITSVQDGISVVFYAERSSSPSTTVTSPVGYTLRDSSFGIGNGSCSTAAADRLTILPTGTSVGGGTWTADVANASVVLWAVSLTAAAPPTSVGNEISFLYNIGATTTVGKNLTVRHNVASSALSATYVGGAAIAPIASTASITLTLPGTVQTGDVAWMMHVYNQLTQDSVVPVDWVLEDTQSQSTSMRARIYSKTLDVSDAGSTVTITNTTAQRMSAVVEVYRAVTVKNASGALIETVSGTVHPGATAASAADGMSIVFMAERSSSPSTSTTSPSGYTLRHSAFGAGNGSTSVAAGDRLTIVPTGTTIGGGAWTNDVANAPVITWAVALTGNVVVTSVGKDLTTRHNVRNRVGSGWTGDVSDLLDDTARQISWNVLSGLAVSVVGKDLSLRANTLSAIPAPLVLRWHTGGTVTAQRALLWHTRTTSIAAGGALTALWTVRRLATKLLTIQSNIEGPGTVGTEITLLWDTGSGIVDPGTTPPPDLPPSQDTDAPPESLDGYVPQPTPADQGLEFDTPQPIHLTLLQEMLELPTHVANVISDTIPPSGDVPVDSVADVPLTQGGIEKLWTEVVPGVSEPVSAAPVPSAPAEPSTNPEI